ncbi:MAG: hypothetical protein QY332_12045 [Anaerolineales bacterium]|nr:MAG: hypothetical protein QY332_12045 [Anaerolineales bacterium]
MKPYLILGLMILTACAPAIVQETIPPPAPTVPAASPTDLPAAETESATDVTNIFSALPAPSCSGVLTPSNAEGPYYTPNTPERTSLLEDGLRGERLILIGHVLNEDCKPIPDVWLDFWQADGDGEYDNAGFTLRGHQFTDQQGRYSLETVLPGLYSSRPIRHIHVKVQAPNGQVLTTQLYFPEQPVDNLTVQVQPKDGFQLALFDFVIE